MHQTLRFRYKRKWYHAMEERFEWHNVDPSADRTRALLDKDTVNEWVEMPLYVGAQPLGTLSIDNRPSQRPLLDTDILFMDSLLSATSAGLGRLRIIEDLQGSESLYHSLVERLPQCIYIKDPSGTFSFANAPFCEYVGTTPKAVVGKTDFDFFSPECAKKFQADDRRVLDGNLATYETEENNELLSGSSITVRVLKMPIKNGHGRIVGTQGIFWDISQSRRVQEELAQSRFLFNALMDNVPDSIYFKDTESRFTRINQALACRLALPNVDCAIGKNDHDYFKDQHADAALDDERRVMLGGQPIFRKEEHELLLDGRDYWVLTTKMPLRNQALEVIGTFGISHDITLIKNAEEALRASATELEARVQERTKDLEKLSADLTMAAVGSIIVHNVATPLLDISQRLDNVESALATGVLDDIRSRVGKIREACQKGLRLLEQVQRVAADHKAETFHLDLNAAVMQWMLPIAEALSAKEVDYRCELAENLPKVPINDIMLRTAFHNICSNALRVLKVGSLFSVRTFLLSPEKVAIEVRDGGPGFPAAMLDGCYVPKRVENALGLGLTIARRIIELHNGNLTLANHVEGGAVVTIGLPLT